MLFWGYSRELTHTSNVPKLIHCWLTLCWPQATQHASEAETPLSFWTSAQRPWLTSPSKLLQLLPSLPRQWSPSKSMQPVGWSTALCARSVRPRKTLIAWFRTLILFTWKWKTIARSHRLRKYKLDWESKQETYILSSIQRPIASMSIDDHGQRQNAHGCQCDNRVLEHLLWLWMCRLLSRLGVEMLLLIFGEEYQKD